VAEDGYNAFSLSRIYHSDKRDNEMARVGAPRGHGRKSQADFNGAQGTRSIALMDAEASGLT